MSPNVGDLKKSAFLKGSDFPKPMIGTITGYDEVNVAKEGAEVDMKWALVFKEFEKPLVLNSTNGQIIAAITGTGDFDGWIGHKVVVYFDPTVSYAGKLTGGIRVRALKTQQPKPPVAPLVDEKAKRLAELRDKMSKPTEKTLDEIDAEADLAAASQEFLDEPDEV